MTQSVGHKVRFGDVDGAGIVFYPRYFEMLNASVEEWFEQGLGVSFNQLHLERRLGCPTVSLQCEFLAPSKLGEELTIEVGPVEVGRSSCRVNYVIRCGGETRVRASGVLVCMDLERGKSAPWSDDIRGGMEAALAARPN